jgi:hypothetical protein
VVRFRGNRGSEPDASLNVAVERSLTRFAAALRDPGESDEPSIAEARRWLAVAWAEFDAVCSRLPQEACHGGPKPGPILRDVEELTDYASAFRYPDAPYEPDAAEAAEALAAAAKLCDEVQRRMESAQEP